MSNPSMCVVRASIACMALVFFTGCGSGQGEVDRNLAKFMAAGPIRPTIDMSKLQVASKPLGAYRVSLGDVIQFDMPRVMSTVKEEIVQNEQRQGMHLARIDSQGRVVLPLLGHIQVAGKTLLEMEEYLVGQYYPMFIKTPPSIVATVSEYNTEPVTVLGAVGQSGTLQLRKEEMSLITLLSKAGGIDDDGARAIRIRRSGLSASSPTSVNGNPYHVRDSQGDKIVLPVEGLDIDFVDMALQAGDVVEVERMEPLTISVIGLVKAAGVFPYPPRKTYTLLDAIALAGGLNEIADPKHATIYRMGKNGELASARFKIARRGKVQQGAALPLKAGDVVAVEQTLETQARLLIHDVVRVGFGVGQNLSFSE